jgi:hypothetical protein
MPILFQAPDVGLIAPDLVIYLDVQPEVFCLYSFGLWCSIIKVFLIFQFYCAYGV